MSKTFEEWYKEEELEEYIEEALENSFWRSPKDVESLLRDAWGASRDSLTWKDI